MAYTPADEIQILRNTIRKLRNDLDKAKDREALLVEMVKSAKRDMERQRISIACFKRRYKAN